MKYSGGTSGKSSHDKTSALSIEAGVDLRPNAQDTYVLRGDARGERTNGMRWVSVQRSTFERSPPTSEKVISTKIPHCLVLALYLRFHLDFISSTDVIYEVDLRQDNESNDLRCYS
jgi:hypothetical protein